MNDLPRSTCQLEDGTICEYEIVGTNDNYGPEWKLLGKGHIKTIRGVARNFPESYVRYFFVKAEEMNEQN